MPRRPRIEPRPAHGKPDESYDLNVFLNVPFDTLYLPMREALVFAVFACGLRPKCALENANFTHLRLDKIRGLIRDSRWGIHDISRTEVNADGDPRFNMPFELGMFIGAAGFGRPEQRRKSCLVLDRAEHRYRRYISDVSGSDPVAHGDDPEQAIGAVRNWIATELPGEGERLESASLMIGRHRRFKTALPVICDRFGHDRDNIPYADHAVIVSDWLRLDRAAQT